MARKDTGDRSRERPAPRYTDEDDRPARRAAKPPQKPQPRGRRPGFVERALRWILGGILRLIWRIFWRAALLLVLVVGAATGYFYSTLPQATELLDGRAKGSVTLLDHQGAVFAWRGDQFGGQLRAGQVSRHVVNAVIATEDKRFHAHAGVDPQGILRALMVNAQAGRLVQGGSTLTQQTAKLIFLGNARSLERKLKEIPLALAMELKYSKEEILSIYLNRVYLGAGTYGFEAAAQRYFGKSAREVSAAEAAMLAGLLKAPSRYAPTSNFEAALGRAGVIIGLMEAQGYLTAAEAAEARANPATLSKAATARSGGYFADWVMESGPAFLTRDTAEDVDIRTTFDPRLQTAAEAALEEVFATKVKAGSNAQAAIVVLSRDGAVRALVGGRDISPLAGQFNRATQARRQTGSVFKPVIYAAALEAGKSPLDLVEDAPLTIRVPGYGPWSPKNYTRDYLGQITLTEALARSINTAAVRVAEATGRDRVREMARKLGMTGEMAPGPALSLGTTEAPLIEMTGVFASFLNEGRVVTPYGLEELRLKGEAEPLMGSDRAPGAAVMTPDHARELVWMLRQVVVSGTGTRAGLPDREIAGKTGTTSAAKDAWFIGFSADHVVGVWMGYDDNKPLTGVTGGGLPAEIFRATMLRVSAGLPATPLPMQAPNPRTPEVVYAGDAAPARDPDADSITAEIFADILRGMEVPEGGIDVTPIPPNRYGKQDR